MSLTAPRKFGARIGGLCGYQVQGPKFAGSETGAPTDGPLTVRLGPHKSAWERLNFFLHANWRRKRLFPNVVLGRLGPLLEYGAQGAVFAGSETGAPIAA